LFYEKLGESAEYTAAGEILSTVAQL